MRYSHTRVYPAIGALLALGAPLGLVFVRAALASSAPTLDWLGHELRADAPTYLYLVLSTTTVFAGLGVLLGRKEDLLGRTATTDGLTGLSNRRHFDARLAEELERAARYKTPLSLLLIDVDGLKAINDRGGHQAGDLALRAVGQALKETCRRTDLGARTGGDEFAVLAPMTGAAEALELANRLRRNLAAIAPVPTVSVGVADLERSGVELQAAADRALYRAKSSGRDRAVAAEPEHPRGGVDPPSEDQRGRDTLTCPRAARAGRSFPWALWARDGSCPRGPPRSCARRRDRDPSPSPWS